MPRVLAYYQATEVEIRGKGSQPFFRARLHRKDARSLAEQLKRISKSEERAWYFLTSSNPEPRRLRLLDLERTPDYELQASPHYMRGQVFAVTGGASSCNINFSVDGAGLLAERLSAAVDESAEQVEIRVPNRRRKLQLVEFLSDREWQVAAEQEALGRSGELLLAETLPREDFSDWEQSR